MTPDEIGFEERAVATLAFLEVTKIIASLLTNKKENGIALYFATRLVSESLQKMLYEVHGDLSLEDLDDLFLLFKKRLGL